ncbi:MAG: ABC transporter ATP-binding protein [Candidatus Accumulibacter sp.]|jgi:putative ABC transport system ATP-binding protein|nr:ABC transporter ATP-binding protein [Accumulibacter sp.]
MRSVAEKLTNGAVKNDAVAPAVILEKVLFRWPGQRKDTLDIPSFSMLAGERVFISGPSGSGKSTLLGIVAGILLPSSGAATVNGICLNELGSAQRDIFRGDHAGIIFQQFNLISYLSILENVLVPCRFSPLRHMRACRQAESPVAEAKTLLERLDLSPSLWGRPVNKLSIGQQQRVAAARALIGQPDILIADEPTSSLDVGRRKAFLRLLLGECRAAGTSLIFVSHDQSLAEDFPRVVHLPDLNRAEEAG